MKLIEMKSGDRVLLSQKKSSVDLPFNPELYKVVKVEEIRVTIYRGNTVKTLNLRRLKLVMESSSRLVPKRKRKEKKEKSAMNKTWKMEGAGITSI